MANWIPELKGIVSALIIAGVTSILTVRLALSRFYKEKWWEKKYEAYSQLLETLHHLKNYAAENYEGQFDPKYITKEKQQELTKDWNKYSREFAKLSDLASFRISIEAISILNKYEKNKAEDSKAESFFEWIEGDLATVSECLDALKTAAKRDLRVR